MLPVMRLSQPVSFHTYVAISPSHPDSAYHLRSCYGIASLGTALLAHRDRVYWAGPRAALLLRPLAVQGFSVIIS
jgi:hypothetical protein